MTGQLTDDNPASTRARTFSGTWDPWFYLHASQQARKFTLNNDLSPPPTDYIPLAEYLFRYDRGGFWVGARAFAYFPFIPFNRLMRWLINDFMHARMLYRTLQGSNMTASSMVQDLSLPYAPAEAFVDYTAEKLDVWPLWVCPLRAIKHPTFHPSCCDDGEAKPMLTIGLWGAASEDVELFVRQNRELETSLTELGGCKVLYSQTFYPEEGFWSLYERELCESAG